MSKRKRFIIGLVAVCLVACSPSTKEGGVGHKPQSRGLAYELVVIVPRQQYAGELQDTLESILLASTPVLNQHEPLFRLNIVYTDANPTPWRTFRNRLLLEIDSKAVQPEMGLATDVVARPQLEVKVKAASVHSLATFLSQHRERLQELFVEAELNVEAANLRRQFNKQTAELLKKMAGHTICVPATLKASKQGKDFLWTGTHLEDQDQNFVFYSYPWDGQPLNPETFVRKRDSVMRVNIPGARPDQWMQTARAPKPLVIARTRTLNNIRVQEVHGLWEMHDAAMGGAFVAQERIDTAARKVLVTEGFIYSPHSPKRNLMRQMEAALRTFK